jgi:outer membrane biosynthesis protein TonB
VNFREFINEDFFYKALILSLTAHLIFISSSLLVPTPHAKTKMRKVEITYESRKKEPVPQPAAKKEQEPPKPVQKLTQQDALNAAVLIKERNAAPDSLKVLERVPDKTKVLNTPLKKTVSVPVLESEKINNPSYQSYYSLVRARIRQRAYFNYAEYYAGEVYLTFILNNDGSLKELKIIEEKSSGGPYLRTIGLKSIKEAVPFPAFPKALNYPELTFNVVISFQVQDNK